MDTAFLIVSIILIIGAELLYWKKSSRNTMITKGQRALAVFQIALCGGFFFLCLSAVLDIKVNFSAVRTAVNIYYAMTFLSMTAFALSDLHKKKEKNVRIIVCLCAALIAVQCFVFPYDAQNEFIRILEAVEGIAVFTMLIILATRISDEKYGQRALAVIVALELAVAVLNTELPTAFITDDIQITDIPMNFLALYMRPVIFASLALIHRIWLDLHKAGSQKE